MADSFWEDLPPIPVKYYPDYQQRVATGFAKMSQSTAVICGVARDVFSFLPQTIKQIEHLGDQFHDYRVIIYENDSTDNTRKLLQDWKNRNRRVELLFEDRGDPVNPATRCSSRMDRMAYYRNQYRSHLSRNFAEFDYGVVLDNDLTGGWLLEGIAHSFGFEDWDLIASNGIIRKRSLLSLREYQYDAWAFRMLDSFQPLPTKTVNHMSWLRGGALVPVSSAFGGLGVYRLPALVNCAYQGGDCEHVGLHRQMKKQGMDRLFLNPSQVVYYGRKFSRTLRMIQQGKNFITSLAKKNCDSSAASLIPMCSAPISSNHASNGSAQQSNV